jgi:TRAP-type C4-dicarboxylate transport system substrate-binding protein
MGKYVIALIVFSIVSVSLVSAGGDQEIQTSSVEPIELTAVSFGPLTHSNALPMQTFIDRIGERSGGELVVKYLGATEIAALYDQPEALRSGVFDMLVIFPAAYAGILPLAAGMNIGNLDPPNWHESGAHDYLVDMHKSVDIRYLGSLASYKQGSYLFLKDEISKPEDISGLKFATGPTNLLAIAAWGGSGVRVPMGEKYSALERGMVAGLVGDVISQYDNSLYEVTDYWLPYSLSSAMTCMLMNETTWNTLPKHLQDLVSEVMLEIEAETTANLETAAETSIKNLIESGMKTIEFPADVAKNFLDVSLAAKWADIEKDVDPMEAAKLKTLLNE